MVLKAVIPPHEIDHSVHFEIVDVVDLDRSDVSIEPRVAESGQVTASIVDLASQPSWRRIRVHLRLGLDASTLRRVAPDIVGSPASLRVLASVRCATTKLRTVSALEVDSDGTWIGDLVVARRDVRGRVEILPVVARASEASQARGGCAVAQHMLLATGVPVLILVDDAVRATSSPIEVRKEDFRASHNPWRKAHATDLYHLDLAGDRPVVYTNSAIPGLDAILECKDTTGVTAALQSLLSAWIGQSCWLQLWMSAATSVRRTEADGTAVGPTGWKEDVLARFLEIMLPDEPSDGERILGVARCLDEAGQFDALASTASSAALKFVDAAKLLSKAIRSAETSS